MRIGIETVFKKQDSAMLCHEIVDGEALREKCLRFVQLAFVASALYGLTMGLNHSFAQGLASALKVFLLFILTLGICLPTLHFAGLLLESSLTFAQTLCVLLAGTSLTCVLLAAFAPIALFFLFSGSSYEFLLILHVLIFACCGAVGLFSVKRNMDTITSFVRTDPKSVPSPAASMRPSEGDDRFTANPFQTPGEKKTKSSAVLLRVWFILYMFIGAQSAHFLSPFVGKETQFIMITSRKGHFFTYVLKTVRDLVL